MPYPTSIAGMALLKCGWEIHGSGLSFGGSGVKVCKGFGEVTGVGVERGWLPLLRSYDELRFRGPLMSVCLLTPDTCQRCPGLLPLLEDHHMVSQSRK